MSRRKISSKHRSIVSGMPPRPRPVVRRARRTRIVIVLGAILMLIGGTLYWHEARRHDAGAPQEPTTADQPTVLIDHSEPASLMRAFPPSVLPGPDSDGWQSEALAARISQQLDRLARLLVDPESIQIDELVELAEPGFTCGPLRPESRREVYRDADVVVSRAIDSLRRDASDVHRGIDGLAVALTSLVGPWSKSTGIQAKFKLIRLEAIGEQMVTTAFYQASGHAPDALLQQNATWKVRWNVARTGSPRLASIVVSQFEEVTTRMSRELFVDETLLRFAQTPLLRDQLARGIDFYQAHIPRRLNVFRFGHHGLALGDVNGDELDDIYLCQPGGLPNRLLIHERDGTLRDVSATAGVDALDFSRSALIIDIDNDGRQDLVVSSASGLLFFAGNGQGGFSLQTRRDDIGLAYSLSAADYDRDGDLDLYICTYYRSDEDAGQFPIALPYHDANNGGSNTLLRNEGGWKFRDATIGAGLDENNRRFSFSAAWQDYENDGDQDLYVANDYGRNNLYRNDNGRFRDVAAAVGVEDVAAGMSACWGDYNRDGRMDIYVGNMFSAAGNRIAYQRRFHAGVSSETKAHFQRHSRGNSLFANSADGTFRDVSVEARVTTGRWAWGSIFADINNDGWEDILVANGYLTGSRKDDL